jgi:hypothetical protein
MKNFPNTALVAPENIALIGNIKNTTFLRPFAP